MTSITDQVILLGVLYMASSDDFVVQFKQVDVVRV